MPDRVGWCEDLATGNPVIDDQHREIFGRAGVLLDKIKAGGVSDEELKKMVVFLSDYVVEHFGSEEMLQKVYDYPGFDSHQDKHDRFIDDFFLLRKKYEAGGSPDIAVELAMLVVTWLMDHIVKEDGAVAAHIRKARG